MITVEPLDVIIPIGDPTYFDMARRVTILARRSRFGGIGARWGILG